MFSVELKEIMLQPLSNSQTTNGAWFLEELVQTMLQLMFNSIDNRQRLVSTELRGTVTDKRLQL